MYNKLAKLQQVFKQQLPEKIAEIEESWQVYAQFDTSNSKLLELHRQFHSLSGSAGTFGAMAVSSLAREIDDKLRSHLDTEDNVVALSTNEQRNIGSLVAQLKKIAINWQLSDIPFIKPEDSYEATPSIDSYENKKQSISNLIYLVEDDELLAAGLVEKLLQEQFKVRHFNNLNDFEAEFKHQHPAVIIMDVVFDEGNTAGIDCSVRLKNTTDNYPPVIFISARDDIEVRLLAVRAGASRYLCKPLNIEKLVSTLDGLTTRDSHKSYRALLIDDDVALLDYYSTVLGIAGIEVKTISKSLDGLKALAEFKPDVILLDVYMPECSGFELAQVIRQDDTWTFIPILFLSSESDLNIQMEARKVGGDDFFMKPVKAEHLVEAVISKAKRTRSTHRLNSDLKVALRENQFQLATMDQHDIVSTTDIAGRITSVNNKFCEISGYNREELLGQNHRILKSTHHPKSFYDDIWNTISNGKVWHGTICNLKKNGNEYWVNSTIVPFLDDKGKPYKYVSARTDFTMLRESEERLQRGQLYAGIGNWDWDIRKNEVYWSDKVKMLYGYSTDLAEASYEHFIKIVHPDDQAAVNDAVKACLENHVKYDIEHRVVWPDGSVHWVLERGDVTRNDAGEPLHMLGVVQDITERVEAENKLRRYNDILELIAKGGVLNDVLKAVILHAEVLLKDGICSILLLDETGKHFTNGVSTGLPDFYNEAIDGLEIGMGVGSCGEAAASGKSVIIGDILEHPNWLPFKKLVIKAGLRACWSKPIFSSAGAILGTFAIYYKNPMEPDSNELKLIEELAQFAAIVVERALSQQVLVKTKEEAENANRAKSKFLSSMSHELRTPMNAIMGFSQLLKMETEAVLTESQLENVDEITKASTHLLELINEVLDLSKIEAGRIDLSVESVAICEVIAEALQLITPLAQKRGIEIILKSAGSDITFEQLLEQKNSVRADRTRLKQVLLNLLSNAVKYNIDNGSITIEYHFLENDLTRLCVSDTGPGLDQEQKNKLFKAFERLGAEQSATEGTGIGLVITKNIVELMGGNIGVESEQCKGSTFWFELPTDTIIAEQQDVTDENKTTDSQPSNSIRYQHTVLYIEDNPANLRLVSQLLARRKNIYLWSAHEPMLGLELAVANKPDLILLDINLPGMDGYGVLKQLRQWDATRHIPVIAISANAMQKDIQRGMDAGFDDYVTKPIDILALLQAVDNKLSINGK